jgi:hypothetical protein
MTVEQIVDLDAQYDRELPCLARLTSLMGL